MGSFQYEWWNVDAILGKTKIIFEVKAKNKENAIKQFEKMNADCKKNFGQNWQILWETMRLDRKGYQRLF